MNYGLLVISIVWAIATAVVLGWGAYTHMVLGLPAGAKLIAAATVSLIVAAIAAICQHDQQSKSGG